MAAAAKLKPLPRLIRFTIVWADQLCILLTCVGLLGLLPLPLVDRHAKFDEKALMVGGASPTFDHQVSLPYGMRLARAAHAHHHQEFANATLAQLVAQHMEAAGMEVHMTHMCAPGPTAGYQGERPSCTHVHGVLHPSQTDGTEALMLVTPVALTQGLVEGRSPYWDAPAEGSLLLLGAVQALVQHLSSVAWLARDVVWVVPDARCGATASLQHWAQTHHGESWSSQGSSGPLGSGGGVPQQALVLQADRAAITSAQVLVEGFDGQLPKLDTYLIVKELTYMFPGMTVQPPPGGRVLTAWATATEGSYPEVSRHLRKLSSLTAFMWRQGVALPTGPHAALKTHMVDAATTRFSAVDASGRRLRAPADPQPGAAPPPLPPVLEQRMASLAQYAELVLRSLNNLDERFHHSFFLYLLTEVQRFVVVEMYIVPLVALIVVLVLKAAKQRHMLRSEEMRPAAGEAAELDPVPGSSSLAKDQQGASIATSGSAQPAVAADDASVPLTARLGRAGLVPAVVSGIWPQAIAIAVTGVLVSFVIGLMLRMALCPACLLCQYPHGATCCAMGQSNPLEEASQTTSSSGGAGQGQCAAMDGMCRTKMHVMSTWAVRLLPQPLHDHVTQLGQLEAGALVASLVIVAATLGWQALLLMCPDTSRTEKLKLPPGPQPQGAADVSHSKHNQRSPAEGPTGTGRPLYAAVRVVVLTISTVMLTGMASMNWALAYCVAAMLASMLVVSQTKRLSSHGLTNDLSPAPRKPVAWIATAMHKIMQLAVVAVTSPVALAWLASSAPLPSMIGSFDDSLGGGAVGFKDTLAALTCCSWANTYLFLWAAYVPCWVFEAVWLWQ